MSNTPTSTVVNCHARAQDYLVRLIGARPEALTWDSTHCLQGHVHVGSHELVVIATRDPSNLPVVMTAPGWDAVRRSSTQERHDLITSCAITDHSRLVSVLSSDEFASHPTTRRLAA